MARRLVTFLSCLALLVSSSCASRQVSSLPLDSATRQRMRVSPIGSLEIPSGYQAYLSRLWPDATEGCIRPLRQSPISVVIRFAGEIGSGTLGPESDYVWIRQEGGIRYGLRIGSPQRLVVGLPALRLEAAVENESQIAWVLELARTFRVNACPDCAAPIRVGPRADPKTGVITYTGCDQVKAPALPARHRRI